MANNRLQIYCKKCLGFANFAKYYPSTGWYCKDRDKNPINDFLMIHSENCYGMVGENEGDDMFGFRTENDDDGFISDYDKLKLKK